MAQTITVANIKLGMNVDEMRKNGEFARHELNSIARMLKDSETPLDKYAAKMQLLDKAYASGGISAATFAQAQDALAKKFGVMTYAMEEAAQAERKLAEEARKAAEAEKALAAEAQRLGSIVSASLTPVQKMANDVKFLDSQFQAGKIDATQYNLAVDMLAKKHGLAAVYADRAANSERKLADAKLKAKQAEDARQANFQTYLEGIRRQSDATNSFGSSAPVAINRATSAISGLAVAGAALGAVKGLTDFGKHAMGLAMQVEQVRAQITVFTQSEEATKKLMAEFIRLDQASALSATDFQDASKILMQFGVGVRDVVPVMESMSEISMGNAQRFQAMALAFGQVQAAGKLTGQEVLQLVNAGFNPLQQISKDTGVSMAELRKRMEEGSISAEMVATAFENATKKGGLFYGMNEKMATTTSVKMSKLQSEFKQFVTAIGEREIKPGVDKALDGILSLVEASKQKKELTQQEKEIYAEAERIEKRMADQERERARLSKQIADERERAAKASKEAIEFDNRKMESERSAFASRINQISEERRKAGMGAENYEKAKLFDDTFQMTEGEKMQAQAALMDMEETKRLNELNAIHASVEAANKQLEIEKQVAAMKEKNFLSSDSLRKEYATLDEVFRRQLADAGDNEKQKEGIRKRAAMAEQSIFARSAFEAQQQSRQGAADKFAGVGEEIAKNIAPTLKAGTKEAFTFMQQENAKSKQQAEQKKLAEDLLAETKKQTLLAENAPRLAFRR
jgi:tape measure domain-containing protein